MDYIFKSMFLFYNNAKSQNRTLLIETYANIITRRSKAMYIENDNITSYFGCTD